MIADLLRDWRAARALHRTRVLMSEVYKPRGVQIWLQAKNKNLGSKSPIEMILEGNGDLVVAEAERMAAW
jgi:hypothetical protein